MKFNNHPVSENILYPTPIIDYIPTTARGLLDPDRYFISKHCFKNVITRHYDAK